MFIENLMITAGNHVIRSIGFHKGINLIVDETSVDDLRRTGNNVGKTTVLKLIDFCLGAKASIVYTDPEDHSSSYELVERFLKDNEVLVTLVLSSNIGDPLARRVTIERNFLGGRSAVRRINGEQVRVTDFDRTLGSLLLPSLPKNGKPSFRQAIGHNVRYDPYTMESTLKTLGPYGRSVEYEALYLFLLGIPHPAAAEKQALGQQKAAEKSYLKRLLNGHSLSDYRTVVSQAEREVASIERRRRDLSVSQDYASKVEELDQTKMQIGRVAASISQLELRAGVIEEARKELLVGIANIDLVELRSLYVEAKVFVPELHRSFEDLVDFHNNMIHERIEFMTRDLPDLYAQIESLKVSFEELRRKSRSLSDGIALLPTGEQIDALVEELGEKMRLKGECEARVEQIEESESRIKKLDDDINACEEDMYSPEHEAVVRERVGLLNEYFSRVSQELYGETYLLGIDIKTDKNGNRYYDLHPLDLVNFSAGKKQGEVLAFDVAYTLFADSQHIECMHFLLNDRKELMHGNQILKVGKLVNGEDIQLVVSILEDKLPEGMSIQENVVLRLSQHDKLFRVETQGRAPAGSKGA